MLSRLSLKTKLTALVVSVVAVASWSFGKFAFRGVLDLLERTSGLRAVTAAEALATSIDPDWFRTVDVTTSLDERYLDLQHRLSALVESGKLYRINLVRYAGKQEVQHILSIPADGSSDDKRPGTREPVLPGDIYADKSAGYHGVELATPGAFMGGWAPITRDGRSVGLVLVAVDGSETQQALNTIHVAISSTMVAFILLSGLTAFKFAATFERTAVTDGLMGIYNHKYFKQRLEGEVAKSRRYGQQTAVVLLDIDYFKKVNDTYGHAVGDLVLKQLARWVLDSSRTTDVVARYGGEEVAVILPHTGMAGAQEFAERLRMKVSKQVIRDPEEDVEFRVTVSIGVAQWEKGLDMLDLIKNADAALYQSKRAGRNRVTIYQDELLSESSQEPVALER